MTTSGRCWGEGSSRPEKPWHSILALRGPWLWTQRPPVWARGWTGVGCSPTPPGMDLEGWVWRGARGPVRH